MPQATAAPAYKPTVAVHYVRVLSDYAGQRGLPATRLLADAGLPAKALDDVDARVPFSTFLQMIECAAEWLADPNLGLHLGQAMRPGYLGAHGFSLMACATVRDLMPRLQRYTVLFHEGCRDEFEERDGLFILNCCTTLPGKAPSGRHHSELNLAAVVTIAPLLTGSQQKPQWVSFRHPAPANLAEHEALFACPLRFNAADDIVAYAASVLDLPLLQPNPPVLQMMDALCERLLQKLRTNAEPAWLQSCKKAIVDALRSGTPSLEQIAPQLELSSRSLRRKLAEQGLSFRKLLDELRCELAQRYIEEHSLTLVETAYRLGFSDQSAFQRAFRRWTGQSPARFRRARSHLDLTQPDAQRAQR